MTWWDLADPQCLVRGVDLCVGGTCRVEDGFQFCVCDPGYGPDLFTFHLANCAVPRYAFEVYFVMFGVLWSGVLVLFAQRVRQANAQDPMLKRIGRMALLYHLSLGCTLMGYLLQGGMFELSAMFTFATFTLVVAILADMLVMVLNVSHEKSSAKLFQLEMRHVVRSFVRFNIGLGIANVAMMRSRHADRYILLSQLGFNAMLVRVVLLARKHSNDLIATLEVGMRFAQPTSLLKLQTIKTRVVKIQHYFGMQVVSALILAGPKLMRLFLGTIPLYYVVLFPMMLSANLFTLGVAELFSGKHVPQHAEAIDFADSVEPPTTRTNDSAHSGYIVGSYKIRMSKTKKRRKRKTT